MGLKPYTKVKLALAWRDLAQINNFPDLDVEFSLAKKLQLGCINF